MADEDGDSLTVIDAATNAVLTTLKGIEEPHNVQVSRDGAAVYAVSGSDDLLVVVEATTFAVRAIAPTGPAPAHVVEAPNGKVYVTNAGDGTVSVYQGRQLQPVGRITLGGMPHGLRASGDGSVIVVANTSAGALDVINPVTDTSAGRVPVGPGPAQVAVTGDGRYAYAGVTKPSAVVKVDLESRSVVATAQVPNAPVQLYLTPDDRSVVSANQGTEDAPGHTASVIDTQTMTVRSTVTAGSGPHGVIIDPAGTRAWVTNTYDDTVSVIDLATSSVVATIRVGEEPNGVSYSARLPAGGGSLPTTLNIPAPSSGSETESGNSHGH
ncbi:hypothetical protein [Mycobacterium sp. 852014-52144_SCH5372336]|uniref:YVTN family beta-propeller repeat protein n=1 Tax=Mycobacterium sp. 852014-52144_SCH5372336 TaxID=1834115 RepID=UPI003518DD1F